MEEGSNDEETRKFTNCEMVSAKSATLSRVLTSRPLIAPSFLDQTSSSDHSDFKNSEMCFFVCDGEGNLMLPILSGLIDRRLILHLNVKQYVCVLQHIPTLQNFSYQTLGF